MSSPATRTSPDAFAGGEGVIGIHWTDDPAAIGTDVRAGFISSHDVDIERLVHDIGGPLGTPVEIQA